MLRAQGCKAERGAGSSWAERPLQPGLAPRRSPPTRPARGPAAPPLRPAPPLPPGTSPPLTRRRAALARAHRCRRRRCHPHHVTRAPAGPAEGPSPTHGSRARTRSPPVRTRERAPGPAADRPGGARGAVPAGSGCGPGRGRCPHPSPAPRALPLGPARASYPLGWGGAGAQGTGGGSGRRGARASHAAAGMLRCLSALLPGRWRPWRPEAGAQIPGLAPG